jgi:hypothetical protein
MAFGRSIEYAGAGAIGCCDDHLKARFYGGGAESVVCRGLDKEEFEYVAIEERFWFTILGKEFWATEPLARGRLS